MKGTLEVGKLADIAVLDQDLLTGPEDAIPSTRADLVVVGGEVVLEEATGPPAWSKMPPGRA